uniref:Uncharacterized protein n=1 Tax=Vitis vinifera TaxID=29760 RepID=F6I1G6_VITVI
MGTRVVGLIFLDNRIMDEDLHCISETSQFERSDSAEKAIELLVQDQDYTGKIKELQAYLDKVNEIVKPGCSPEVLKVALNSISSLVNFLSHISSSPKPLASL